MIKGTANITIRASGEGVAFIDEADVEKAIFDHSTYESVYLGSWSVQDTYWVTDDLCVFTLYFELV